VYGVMRFAIADVPGGASECVDQSYAVSSTTRKFEVLRIT